MSTRDPGAATGAPVRPLLPHCRCDHSAYVHLPKDGKRTSCASWHGGRCGCKQYAPKEET